LLCPKEVTAVPYKAKKPCASQGCRNLTGGRYCEEHAKQEAKRYNQYDRDPNSNKRYGRSWARIRAAFLSANPLCERCKRDGRLTPAEMAHHKVRLTDGGTNDWNNLQALCQECHSRLHAERGDYF
jgi:5-methylcytosine-specific restriction protein A